MTDESLSLRWTMKRSLFLLAVIAAVVALAPKPGYAHRYFDTWAARWTTPDPALNANPQIVVKKHGYRIFEVSPYVYCSENPIKYVDPNGKQGGLSLGGPILLPTSLRQLEYNVVATLTASAVTPGMVYAPGVTATLVGNILGNPATAAAVGAAAAESLAPPGASMNPGGDVSNALSGEVEGGSHAADVLSQMMKGTSDYSQGQLTMFEKQLSKDGMESLLESRATFSERLAEHLQNLEQYEKAGGYTSSVKREIRNFQQQINAIDEVIRRHN